MNFDNDQINRDPRTKRYRAEPPTIEDVMRRARDIFCRANPHKERSVQVEEQEFRSYFGLKPSSLLRLWNLLVRADVLPPDGQLKHLLWTMMFLKVYAKTPQLCALAGGVDKNTFYKWVWQFVDSIVQLEPIVIKWENRKKRDKGNDCLVSTDCADFRVPQHGSQFSSHKYNKKSALRYEICLCILTGDIVWINGPYECGYWPDIEIFRDSLKSMLEDNERVEADDGYVGEHPEHIKCPSGFANPEDTEFMQQRVRNRQESINSRMKNWGALNQTWRHDINRHGDAFRTIAVASQVSIDDGDKLFETGYRDPPYDEVESSSDDDML